MGSLFSVMADVADIFRAEDLPKGTGFCLDAVLKTEVPANADIARARTKIGSGVMISKGEGNVVWLYNRSSFDVFVSSPSLTTDQHNAELPVVRVPLGHTLAVYDEAVALAFSAANRQRPQGPLDAFSVNVSFGKGWGEGFKRPDVTACPCWLQICLPRPRSRS